MHTTYYVLLFSCLPVICFRKQLLTYIPSTSSVERTINHHDDVVLQSENDTMLPTVVIMAQKTVDKVFPKAKDRGDEEHGNTLFVHLASTIGVLIVKHIVPRLSWSLIVAKLFAMWLELWSKFVNDDTIEMQRDLTDGPKAISGTSRCTEMAKRQDDGSKNTEIILQEKSTSTTCSFSQTPVLSDQASVQQTAETILRPNTSLLIKRLTYPNVEHLAQKLLDHHTISVEELENITYYKTATWSARQLVMCTMIKKSWEDGVQFARFLKQTEGLHDIGTRLLVAAGVSDEQPLDTQKLVKENCLLRNKIPGKNLMLTAYRCELMKRAGKTEDVDTFGWKVLPMLPPNRSFALNCVTSCNGTIVVSFWGRRELHTLAPGVETWQCYKSDHGQIRNVFSSQNNCYVYVVEGADKKIYSWNENDWHFVTDIPISMKNDMGVSLTADDNDHIYILGGENSKRDNSLAYVYDLKRNGCWQPLPDIPSVCYLASAFHFDNTLYAAGGRTRNAKSQHSVLTNIFQLPLNGKHWNEVQSLTNAGATVAPLCGKLIATGGKLPEGPSVKKAEVLDMRFHNKWLPLPDMMAARFRHGVCTTTKNCLVVVGGCGSNKQCELFSCINNY